MTILKKWVPSKIPKLKIPTGQNPETQNPEIQNPDRFKIPTGSKSRQVKIPTGSKSRHITGGKISIYLCDAISFIFVYS